MPNNGTRKCIGGQVHVFKMTKSNPNGTWINTLRPCKTPAGKKPKGGCPEGYKWDRQFAKCVKK